MKLLTTNTACIISVIVTAEHITAYNVAICLILAVYLINTFIAVLNSYTVINMYNAA